MEGKILAGKILLEVLEVEEKSASGIILPKAPGQKGRVVLVGKETSFEKMEISLGDVVIFKKGSGHALNFDGDSKDYLLITQNDTLIYS